MGKETLIGWSDSTVNPTSGCDGCELWTPGEGGPCYAGNYHQNRMANALPQLYAADFSEVRLIPGRMAKAAAWSDLTGTARPDKPWLDGMPRVIFIGDMGDTLSRAVPFEYLKSEIVDVVTSAKGRRHVWMWLTKQAPRMAAFSDWLKERGVAWPANLWPGCSVTTQATVARVGHLLRVGDGDTVRFVSAEPLLGPVDFGWHFARYRSLVSGLRYANAGAAGDHEVIPCVDLVIVGEESGAARRRWDLSWPRSILAQCRAAGCAFFCKQMDVGGKVTEDMTRFPEDLRVREFPRPAEVAHA